MSWRGHPIRSLTPEEESCVRELICPHCRLTMREVQKKPFNAARCVKCARVYMLEFRPGPSGEG